MEKRHFVALDGLRGVAALAVVFGHTAHWTLGPSYPSGAYLAVDFFFMLSGFVIDHAYAERLRTGMKLRAFLLLRFIRLYPLIVFGALLAVLDILIGRVFHFGRLLPAATFPFAALALPSPFLDPNPFVLNPPSWSLFFELVANLVFAVALVRLEVKWLVTMTAVCAAAYAWMIVTTGTVGHGNEALGSAFSLGFIRVAFPFVLGMLLNRIASRGGGGDSRFPFGWPRWFSGSA